MNTSDEIIGDQPYMRQPQIEDYEAGLADLDERAPGRWAMFVEWVSKLLHALHSTPLPR